MTGMKTSDLIVFFNDTIKAVSCLSTISHWRLEPVTREAKGSEKDYQCNALLANAG